MDQVRNKNFEDAVPDVWKKLFVFELHLSLLEDICKIIFPYQLCQLMEKENWVKYTLLILKNKVSFLFINPIVSWYIK